MSDLTRYLKDSFNYSIFIGIFMPKMYIICVMYVDYRLYSSDKWSKLGGTFW